MAASVRNDHDHRDGGAVKRQATFREKGDGGFHGKGGVNVCVECVERWKAWVDKAREGRAQ
jgi:hypothetical protein